MCTLIFLRLFPGVTFFTRWKHRTETHRRWNWQQNPWEHTWTAGELLTFSLSFFPLELSLLCFNFHVSCVFFLLLFSHWLLCTNLHINQWDLTWRWSHQVCTNSPSWKNHRINVWQSSSSAFLHIKYIHWISCKLAESVIFYMLTLWLRHLLSLNHWHQQRWLPRPRSVPRQRLRSSLHRLQTTSPRWLHGRAAAGRGDTTSIFLTVWGCDWDQARYREHVSTWLILRLTGSSLIVWLFFPSMLLWCHL